MKKRGERKLLEYTFVKANLYLARFFFDFSTTTAGGSSTESGGGLGLENAVISSRDLFCMGDVAVCESWWVGAVLIETNVLKSPSFFLFSNAIWQTKEKFLFKIFGRDEAKPPGHLQHLHKYIWSSNPTHAPAPGMRQKARKMNRQNTQIYYFTFEKLLGVQLPDVQSPLSFF